jgi:hypothetical protein
MVEGKRGLVGGGVPWRKRRQEGGARGAKWKVGMEESGTKKKRRKRARGNTPGPAPQHAAPGAPGMRGTAQQVALAEH